MAFHQSFDRSRDMELEIDKEKSKSLRTMRQQIQVHAFIHAGTTYFRNDCAYDDCRGRIGGKLKFILSSDTLDATEPLKQCPYWITPNLSRIQLKIFEQARLICETSFWREKEGERSEIVIAADSSWIHR